MVSSTADHIADGSGAVLRSMLLAAVAKRRRD